MDVIDNGSICRCNHCGSIVKVEEVNNEMVKFRFIGADSQAIRTRFYSMFLLNNHVMTQDEIDNIGLEE